MTTLGVHFSPFYDVNQAGWFYLVPWVRTVDKRRRTSEIGPFPTREAATQSANEVYATHLKVKRPVAAQRLND